LKKKQTAAAQTINMSSIIAAIKIISAVADPGME
jgi:hypothetical protein